MVRQQNPKSKKMNILSGKDLISAINEFQISETNKRKFNK